MNSLIKLLATFEYKSFLDFGYSLMPSKKYDLSEYSMIITAILVVVEKWLSVVMGIDGLGFVAIFAAFVLEWTTGVIASQIRNEAYSSVRGSRFSLKVACYLFVISIPYVLGNSLVKSDRGLLADVGGQALGWLSTFLIIQITQENIVSVLENLAVISGKDKSSWITAITDKFKSLLK